MAQSNVCRPPKLLAQILLETLLESILARVVRIFRAQIAHIYSICLVGVFKMNDGAQAVSLNLAYRNLSDTMPKCYIACTNRCPKVCKSSKLRNNGAERTLGVYELLTNFFQRFLTSLKVHQLRFCRLEFVFAP